ncbi:hypothetical protein ANOM_009219 [Aspergillus nomiae NRRL 13137]|uniref:Uncharacterized protein n=1 Tax=Aspergillus nomiae NRRL (strain ATCC 15546 / NRRL 13137 / CBS 260.88 / M93) TaxID=1509407 RepID=A0A0L1IP04_ASPN3|nr:uncharacterized protein ANOM_009219 [Aspergillus nomiae NRRL 13137]KNG81234.1 hypothetical protein ANOM_009219 [Aspergillus nomiae NRRL 13137]
MSRASANPQYELIATILFGNKITCATFGYTVVGKGTAPKLWGKVSREADAYGVPVFLENILWNAELHRALIIDFHLRTLDRPPLDRRPGALKRLRCGREERHSNMEPISPEAQRYENAFYSAMNWRCLFRTKDGLIGMGPMESLGDTLEELEARLSEWKTGAKKQHRLSGVDTEREIASLKQKIAELHAQVGRKDAWVLIGEAYVEGVMRGEALDRAGVDSFERIAIV